MTGTGGPTDAKLIYSFYVPRDPSGADGTQTPDLPSGGFTPSPNTATASGNWTPLDPRDPTTTATGTSNTVTLTEKSLAIQKGVTDVNGNPTNAVAVGDDLQYTLNFQVSDFFAFENLIATDLFSDGQHLDAGFTPILTVTDHGVTHTINLTSGLTYFLAPQSGTDGSDLLTFDVSQALIDAGFSGQLLGGSIPAGGTGGAEPSANPAFGSTPPRRSPSAPPSSKSSTFSNPTPARISSRPATSSATKRPSPATFSTMPTWRIRIPPAAITAPPRSASARVG